MIPVEEGRIIKKIFTGVRNRPAPDTSELDAFDNFQIELGNVVVVLAKAPGIPLTEGEIVDAIGDPNTLNELSVAIRENLPPIR